MGKRPLSRKLQMSFLGAVIEFMARIGISEEDIRSSFERGMVRAREAVPTVERSRSDEKYRADGDVSAYLLRLWCRDQRFMDSIKLTPRPLPLLRGKNNLRCLIASLDPRVDAVEVLKAMKAARLIRRVSGGRYLPTDDGAIFSSLHPWAIEHTAKSVIRLVTTVFRNASGTTGEPPLLERYSYVPDLDPANRQAFAEFTRLQGLTYLQAVDDWLEQSRVRNPRRALRARANGITAGVHLITYLGEPSKSPGRSKKSTQGKSERRVGFLKAPTSPPSTPA